MAQNSQLESEPAALENPKKDNLVAMPENGNEKQVLEINKQMATLESSISRLTKKLNATNKQIKSDVSRLTSSDADISEKVADTYKQLGAIEHTFDELSQSSSQLTTDLKKVNKNIKAFEKSSAEALNKAIDNQSEINADVRQQHDDIIARAAKLSKNVKTISTKLTKSIKENHKALTELEARIVTELENVAQSSEVRDSKLDERIDSSNEEINSQKAKMLLMQSVDEALEKRTAALEVTSDNLIAESQNLRDTTETLDVLTSKLSTDVEALEAHTAKLAEQNEQQQGMIDELDNKTSSITRTLLALASLERKHFNVLAGASILLLLAVIGVFFYGQYQRDTSLAAQTEVNANVDEQVNDLQNRVEDEQLASQVFYSDIVELQKNLTDVKSELQQKTAKLEQVVASKAGEIEKKIVAMNDQVESLDGRIRYMAPLYNFGSDNTIHGSEWLSKLDANKFSIKIATVGDKQELYDIAQRYNRYFTQELGYFQAADNQYTLIYGGNFDNEQQIAELMRRMPSFMGRKRIAAISNADVLNAIKK
jgi:DNA repair exonuclease SbcCD ATPase subunit